MGVIGGMVDGNTTNMVQSLDLYTNEVSMLASLNKHRYSHACSKATWDGEEFIVVAGGFETYSVCSSVEYISACVGNNGEENVWATLSPMNIRRYDFGLTMYGTLLAAFGGEPTISSEEIEVYNFTSQTWTLTGKKIAHPERHYFTAISVPVEDLPEEQTTETATTRTSKATEITTGVPSEPTFSMTITTPLATERTTGVPTKPSSEAPTTTSVPAETTTGVPSKPSSEASTTTSSPEITTEAPSKPSSEAQTATSAPETTTGAPSKPSSEATETTLVPESTTVIISNPSTTANIKKLIEDIEYKEKNIENMLDDIEAKDESYYTYSKYL